jgi:hypothetical protein
MLQSRLAANWTMDIQRLGRAFGTPDHPDSGRVVGSILQSERTSDAPFDRNWHLARLDAFAAFWAMGG